MEKNLQLSRREIHFLSQLLFYVNNTVSLSLGDANEAADLQRKIDKFLLNEDEHKAVSCEIDDCYCEEEDEYDQNYPVEPDKFVESADFSDFKKFKVLNEDAEPCTLKFIVTDYGFLDIEIDDGAWIINGVTLIERGAKHIDVFSSGEWIRFDCQKFPKEMTSLIKPGLIYGVKACEQDEGEQ